ncbi:YbhN family protein [Dactylosporangium siamense]|uniref:Flippase-like domain-containing protein n=1 Tax=Dactylosporangium siamense TaxID=685454 RepID=A0A919PH51_9ACTN|nr:lysylphosphatidylglycerol synthase domain-containing protein [Dactylosporangium siamense]GIG43844.1 hypothetical protein Dsi01nite_018850 [Dactylosporangium siamense]
MTAEPLPALGNSGAAGASRRHRWVRALLLLGAAAAVTSAAAHLSSTGASWSRAGHLISGVGPRWLLVLGVVWLVGLWVHTVVLTTALPGLTSRRALTLNLSGSAVSNVMPLGGLAGTTLNLAMVRGWGHSNLDFARFVVVSKATDMIAKLVMPLVAVVALVLCGAAPSGHVTLWLSATGALAASGGLVVAALLGRATLLLRLVAAADRLRVRIERRRDRRPDGLWTSVAADLFAGAGSLVRRRWARLSWGMAAYWLLQGTLLWCCCAAVGLRAVPAVVLAALVAERALTLLAITPGGSGLVEAGTIGVLIVLGADPTASLAAILVFRAFVFAAEIPVGGMALGAWLLARRAARS